MKIGIVVFSKTGNSFNVARKIASQLTSESIDSDILRLKVEGDLRPRSSNIAIITPPSIDNFDAVIFITPVWAFTAAPVVPAYLKSKHNLQGKKVLTVVTMGLPFSFMGGIKAINVINALASEQGAIIQHGEIVKMSDLHNESKLSKIVSQVTAKIK